MGMECRMDGTGCCACGSMDGHNGLEGPLRQTSAGYAFAVTRTCQRSPIIRSAVWEAGLLELP